MLFLKFFGLMFLIFLCFVFGKVWWMVAGRTLYIVLAALVVLGFVGVYIVFFSGGDSPGEVRDVPLYEVVEPVSFEEFIGWVGDYVEEEGLVLKLPTKLPEGLSPVSVWYIGDPFLAVIAFDDGPVDSYVNASFAVQVTLLDSSLYDVEPDRLMDMFRRFVAEIRLKGREAFVTTVDEFYVVVAYSDLRSYTAYVYDLEGGFRYVLVFKDLSLLPEDVLDIIASMEPIEI